MVPEGLVTPLLVFRTVPSFEALNKDIPVQAEPMEALELAGIEM